MPKHNKASILQNKSQKSFACTQVMLKLSLGHITIQIVPHTCLFWMLFCPSKLWIILRFFADFLSYMIAYLPFSFLFAVAAPFESFLLSFLFLFAVSAPFIIPFSICNFSSFYHSFFCFAISAPFSISFEIVLSFLSYKNITRYTSNIPGTIRNSAFRFDIVVWWCFLWSTREINLMLIYNFTPTFDYNFKVNRIES